MWAPGTLLIIRGEAGVKNTLLISVHTGLDPGVSEPGWVNMDSLLLIMLAVALVRYIYST